MAASYREDGTVDWEKFHELIKDYDITFYDPPQKKADWACEVRNVNLFTPRSPWFRGFPCCVAEFIQCCNWACCGGNIQHVKISEPDKWFMEMMEPPGPENKCPEFLRGVWWMKDNVANENILSFESAWWSDDGMEGWKNGFVNWTTGPSWYGSYLLLFKKFVKPHIQRDPIKKKWITLTRDDWIYVLGPEDRLVDPKGNEVPFIPGEDLLRITWKKGDPKKSQLFYQYIVRRVAYKDKDGKLVKTPRYDELLERAQRPTEEGVCCNFFLCNIPDEKYGLVYDSLTDNQMIIPGPEWPGEE